MGAADQSPCDPAHVLPPPAIDGAPDSDFVKEQESLRRAMPVQRLHGSGMRYDDAIALHDMSASGVAWHLAGCWLGDRNMRLAQASDTPAGGKSFFRYASACYRAAQAALPQDTDEKRRIFTAMVDAFGLAAALDEPVTEKREIPWRGGKLCGWLFRPAGKVRPPVVIIMGGFDGWREEYWPGAEQLVQRGIAAFLVDGPGQGETRLKYGLYMDESFHLAFSAMADHLLDDPELGDAVGIWGNSLGGFLAARTVAADPRFAALCVNGGAVKPIEFPERFPRFWEKVEALVGGDYEHAKTILSGFDLTDLRKAITCPLLQLHSVPDQVFLLENARGIYDGVSSQDKVLRVWDDGDHCIYNHSEEKNIIVADWFAKRVVTR